MSEQIPPAPPGPLPPVRPERTPPIRDPAAIFIAAATLFAIFINRLKRSCGTKAPLAWGDAPRTWA